ncbi:MAG: carboxypeptidase regulatory-like domain-containing protein [Bryobacteraceae bacterium]|nr:carboxypeptidase regulatory-like domain-containing protein [Bryobacteraceae bacterium]
MAIPATAQTAAARLAVAVVDPQESAVPGARVVVRLAAWGWETEARTDERGLALFPLLPPGVYDVAVEHEPFAPARRSGVALHANESAQLRLALRLGARGDSITVTDPVAPVQEGPARSTPVSRSFLAALPLNGRTFQSMIQLAPGVVLMPASLPSQGQFSVNGQRPGSNYFTVDGVSANFGLPFATTPYEGAGGSIPVLTSLGSTSALASVEAVEEVTVLTSAYAPEYGRQPGAQVAIVTRSGGNRAQASLYHYLRNDRLDANSWFGNARGLPRPALRQNNFGFSAGGPVLLGKIHDGRNRTFFFTSYEGLRLVQPVVSQPSRVPSLAARQRASGLLRQILDAYPLPVAAPLAESPDETPYVAAFSNPSRLNATSVRVDHFLRQRVWLFGRVQHAPSESRERGRYATPSFVAVLPAEADTATLGASMSPSAAWQQEVRVNWSRSRASQIYRQDTFGGARILPPEAVLPPFARPETSLFYLTIGANDENTISPGNFSRNTQRQWNVTASMGWIRGRHFWKWGMDWRRLAPSIGGRLYTMTWAVPSITVLASGVIPTAEIRQVDRFLEPRYLNHSAFVQDAWRLHPRLTLTYGLRWEANPAPGEANGNQPLTVRGIENPPSAHLAPRGSRLYATQWLNLAPRIGAAWQPLRGRGLVVRGGAGVFYDLGYAFTGTAFSPSNYPFSRIRTLVNVPVGDPALLAEAPPQSFNPPYPRLFAYAGDYRLPYSWQYNVALEQPVGADSLASVAYVGALGRRLPRVESLRSQVLQNPLFTRVDAVNNLGSSSYNALQAQFRRTVARRWHALASWTWSKSLDTASDESISNFQAPSVRYDPRLDRGRSSFDVRHAVSAAVGWGLPSPASGLARILLGGFALDAVLVARTATPVNVVTGRDPLGLGLTNVSRPDLLPGQPLYLRGPGYPGGRRVNPAAFQAAAPLAEGRQGTLGRNSVEGFPLRQADVSVRRRFRLGEHAAADFRADAFNITNTPNFANPVAVLTSPSFGLSTQLYSMAGVGGLNPLYQAGGPRSLQLSLRLQF